MNYNLIKNNNELKSIFKKKKFALYFTSQIFENLNNIIKNIMKDKYNINILLYIFYVDKLTTSNINITTFPLLRIYSKNNNKNNFREYFINNKKINELKEIFNLF